MGNPGTAAAPNTLDSSNCGGFNFDQVSAPQPSTPQAVTFIFGAEKFIVTPSTITPGDIITFRPVPMPAGQFNLKGGSTLPGTPPAIGAGQQCVSVADFAANLNPVCPEFQTHCLSTVAGFNTNGTCNDAESFFWTGEFDFHLDPNAGYPLVSGVPAIGGVHFLGAPGVSCPQSTLFSEDIVLSYQDV